MTKTDPAVSQRLIALRKTANKLDVDFKMETTEEELAPLVEAAKAKAEADAEKAKELATLRKEAGKLGVQYTEATTGEELAELIKEAKAEGADDGGTAFEVYNRDGGFARTYTHEIHGKAARAKADEFAKKIGGTVKKA